MLRSLVAASLFVSGVFIVVGGAFTQAEQPIDSQAVPESAVSWTAEAEDRRAEVPAVLRQMVRRATEAYAQRNRHSEITPKLMDEVRETIGFP